MRRKSSGNIWFFLILFFIFGGTGILPLFLIAAACFLIMHFAVKQSNANDQTVNNRATRSYGYAERRQGNAHTASDLAKINVYLRKYFKVNTTLHLPNDLQLIVRTDKYSTLSNLDVYRGNARLGTMNEFRGHYNELYDTMFDNLLAMAENTFQPSGPTIIEAEVVENKPAEKKAEPAAAKPAEPAKPEVKEELKAEQFLRQINDLNANIPDEEVSNGLYEMAALLRQVSILESKFPESAKKMHKMYEYYLPYMVQILGHYENIQTIRSDVNYERNLEQLKSTVRSINEALNNIIPTMSDSEFTNLSADMATLEALLQKEGLTGGMDINQPQSKL